MTGLHFNFGKDVLYICVLIDFNKTLSMVIKHFKAQNCIVGDKPHIRVILNSKLKAWLVF